MFKKIFIDEIKKITFNRYPVCCYTYKFRWLRNLLLQVQIPVTPVTKHFKFRGNFIRLQIFPEIVARIFPSSDAW